MKTIAVLGPGLIGGSILKAVQKFLPDVSLRAWARREEAADWIRNEGLAEVVSTQIPEVVNQADLVILAMPVDFMADAVQQFPQLSADVIVTDVGSVKAKVVDELEPLVSEKGGCFIGSHPMAGSEKTGIEFATEDLFVGAPVIVTEPKNKNHAGRITNVQNFWQALGGDTTVLSAEKHDEAVAAISHLPHVIAAALARKVDSDFPDSLPLAAGGFRDTTRIAGGDAEMWRGILESNRSSVISQMEAFREEFDDWLEILRNSDSDRLLALLQEARLSRAKLD